MSNKFLSSSLSWESASPLSLSSTTSLSVFLILFFMLCTLKNVSKNDWKLILGGVGIKMSWVEKIQKINNRGWGEGKGGGVGGRLFGTREHLLIFEFLLYLLFLQPLLYRLFLHLQCDKWFWRIKYPDFSRIYQT